LEKIMAKAEYEGMAMGLLELSSEAACFAALDVASKTAEIKVQAIERNRVGAGACLKIRGELSDVRAAMDAAVAFAKQYAEILTYTIIPRPTEGTEIAMAMTIGK